MTIFLQNLHNFRAIEDYKLDIRILKVDFAQRIHRSCSTIKRNSPCAAKTYRKFYFFNAKGNFNFKKIRTLEVNIFLTF